MLTLVKISPVVLKNKIFKYYSLFSHNFANVTFNLIELQFPSPKYALCQVWLKLTKWFWRKNLIKIKKKFKDRKIDERAVEKFTQVYSSCGLKKRFTNHFICPLTLPYRKKRSSESYSSRTAALGHPVH